MSPDGLDDLDRALASGLSALAPEVLDADETLASLRPRFERARTRARVVKAGSALLALVAVGTAATLAAPTSTRPHVSVSSPSTATPTTERPRRSSTTSTPTTTVPVQTGDSTPTSVTTPKNANTGDSTPGSVPAAVPMTVSASGDRNGAGSSGNGSGVGQSPTTTVAPASDVRTFGSPEGSITVRFAHGEVRLLQVIPANGYGYVVHDSGPAHVEVRFTRFNEVRSRIELQIENGRLVRLDHSNN